MPDEHPEVIPDLDDDVPTDDTAEEDDADAAHDGVLPGWDPEEFSGEGDS